MGKDVEVKILQIIPANGWQAVNQVTNNRFTVICWALVEKSTDDGGSVWQEVIGMIADGLNSLALIDDSHMVSDAFAGYEEV